MPVNIPAGTYHCKLLWRADGDAETMIATLGVEPQVSAQRPEVEVAEAVALAWDGAWGAATLSSLYTFVGCDVTSGGPQEQRQVASFAVNIRGGNGDAVLPTNCAVLVRKRTAFGGNTQQGRMFLPAGYLMENSVDHVGQIASTFRTTMQARMDQFRSNLMDSSQGQESVLSDLRPILFHGTRKSGAAGALPTPIVSFQVDPRIATQRGRMR